MENLRNTLTVLFTLLLCWSVPSYSEEVVTYLDLECQIEDQTVLGVIDGKPQSYNGVKDSYKVGDYLTIKIRGTDSNLVYETIWEPKRVSFGMFPLPIKVTSDRKNGTSVTPNGSFQLDVTENEIRIVDLLFVVEVTLKRYYKSDWEGFVVSGPYHHPQMSIDIVSLDCRTKTNNLVDLLRYGKPVKD